MESPDLEIVIFAGPNGAGKTTFARQILPVIHPAIAFLNVDEIYRTIRSVQHPVSAGREMIRRMAALEERRRSFALETTLSSTMYVKHIHRWRALGYRTSLHFIEAPSADDCVRRVAARVEAGGHDVPEEDIRRRFRRGLRLFHDVYKAEVTQWYHWQTTNGGLRFVERSG